MFGSTNWEELTRWAGETDKFPFVLIDGPFASGIRRWGFETFFVKVIRKDPEVSDLVAWQSYRYAAEMKRVGLVSTTVRFPVHWVIYLVFVACLILALAMVAEFFLPAGKDVVGEEANG